MVSAEDVDASRFTAFDVVLPLPGSRIAYPENDTRQARPNSWPGTEQPEECSCPAAVLLSVWLQGC